MPTTSSAGGWPIPWRSRTPTSTPGPRGWRPGLGFEGFFHFPLKAERQAPFYLKSGLLNIGDVVFNWGSIIRVQECLRDELSVSAGGK